MSDLKESCKEFVRRTARYLIDRRAVRSLLGKSQGI